MMSRVMPISNKIEENVQKFELLSLVRPKKGKYRELSLRKLSLMRVKIYLAVRLKILE